MPPRSAGDVGSTAVAEGRDNEGRAAPDSASKPDAGASNANGRESGLYVRPSELTAKRETPGRLAGEMHSRALDESQRAATGATMPHPHERGADGEKTSPVTVTSVPPEDRPIEGDTYSANGAGAAPSM